MTMNQSVFIELPNFTQETLLLTLILRHQLTSSSNEGFNTQQSKTKVGRIKHELTGDLAGVSEEISGTFTHIIAHTYTTVLTETGIA